ncbi:MAG TPA: M13 family metallopeptidase [Thermoanaerobaculia bacterium]|nr:M13 family metallopeptidase [Thermoanaerobaculia bacterium]
MRRFAAFFTLLLASCATQTATSPPPQPAGSGFDVANLDRSVSACHDFFRFANGGWVQRTQIPPAYSRWGSFHILNQNNKDKMRTILEAAARGEAGDSTEARKVGDFYATCMDEATIERAGIRPLESDLARIDLLRSTAELPMLIAHLHTYRVPVAFAFTATQDARDTERVVASISQSGIGLPDRDYYTNDDARSVEIRERYVQHIARMLELSGYPAGRASGAAQAIMALETKLAMASMTNVELRDPVATYNKLTRAEIEALAPSFTWSTYLVATDLASIDSAIIGQPRFLEELGRQIDATPLQTWKDYFRWHLVNSAAETLPSRFEQADFDFWDRFLEGKKEMLPRWKRCAAATDVALGEALGRLWTERYFPESAKAEAMEMVRNLMSALREDINTLKWMGPTTRQQAIVKLQAFVTKIGYPDKWRDYSPLTVVRGPFVANTLAANRFEFYRDLARIGKPVDRTEWLMTPPTVNAYNNPTMNEIVFPAGILQPPFYDPNADDAYNYGGMGAVIGHELIHGFDDQGRQYDARGNLADWWSAEDKAGFLERARCVSEQFSSFEVADGLRMSGDLVLGESIADLGGLDIAFAAYLKSQEGKPRRIIDGFTPEQRFFLGWAQVWAEKATPEFERLQVTTDPHPLARFRVNGPLSNLPAFAEAFSCRATDPMVRSDQTRCDIW